MSGVRLPQLLVLLDEREGGHAADVIAADALAAGARFLLWRAPKHSPREYMDRARSIARIAAPYGAILLVHDRADVAIAVAADGCHLPERGLTTQDARAVLGRDRIIGRSLHELDQLEDRALVATLSYATLSPIYPTPSKPGYGPALSPSIFEEAGRRVPNLPLYALGGITPERVSACLEAGAHGVAVMGGISHAEDPYEATVAYLEALR